MYDLSKVRGRDYCRSCSSNDIFSALNLGLLPIANELSKVALKNYDVYPLELSVCRSCCMGQVADVVTRNRLFSDYRYLSSTSKSFVQHASDFVDQMMLKIDFSSDDYVLEIASNDGYLLSNFIQKGVRVLGVEPAKNVVKIAEERGIPSISEFFGLDLARKILREHGYPRLIIANNVLAHVPDIQDFVAGLAELTNELTLISIENPSLCNILEGAQFDTIYHEHYSYLSCLSVSNVANRFGLAVFDLDKIATHGGSNRYWMKLNQSEFSLSLTLKNEILRENRMGLSSPLAWETLASNVEDYSNSFSNFLSEQKAMGRLVVGYGAAAKASTLINLIGITSSELIAIADASPEKQEYFMPSANIPIVSPSTLVSLKPDIVIIFVWNISQEILSWLSESELSHVEVWRTIPNLERIQ